MRLLLRSVSKGDSAGACYKEAPGTPVDSECLKWKSTKFKSLVYNFAVIWRNIIWEKLD